MTQPTASTSSHTLSEATSRPSSLAGTPTKYSRRWNPEKYIIIVLTSPVLEQFVIVHLAVVIILKYLSHMPHNREKYPLAKTSVASPNSLAHVLKRVPCIPALPTFLPLSPYLLSNSIYPNHIPQNMLRLFRLPYLCCSLKMYVFSIGR